VAPVSIYFLNNPVLSGERLFIVARDSMKKRTQKSGKLKNDEQASDRRFTRKFMVFSIVMALVTAISGAGGFWYTIKASSKSDENIAIDAHRSFEPKNIHMVVDYSTPVIRDEWAVDIYNRSTNAIAIRSVSIVGYSATTMTSMVTMSPNESPNDETGMPFMISGGDVKRLVLQAAVPAQVSSMSIFKKCFDDDFSKVQKCLTQQGVDELGNAKGIRANSAVEILVTDSFGRQYSAQAPWFPGETLPRYGQMVAENN
jgi:hypothetical protein